jgi:hypothetical protein
MLKVIAFLTDYYVVGRVINNLKLQFIAEKPPPSNVAFREYLMAAEAGGEYLS